MSDQQPPGQPPAPDNRPPWARHGSGAPVNPAIYQGVPGGGAGPSPLPPRSAPRRRPRTLTPGVILVLLIAIGVVAGGVWFGLRSRRDDETASGTSTSTTAAATGSTTASTTTAVQPAGVAPTLPAKARGTAAQLCGLEGTYREAVDRFRHVADAPDDDAAAERIAEGVLPLYDQLGAAAPASVYEAIRGQYDTVANIATLSEANAAFQANNPNISIPDLGNDPVGGHYYLAVADLALGDGGKQLDAFFAACP